MWLCWSWLVCRAGSSPTVRSNFASGSQTNLQFARIDNVYTPNYDFAMTKGPAPSLAADQSGSISVADRSSTGDAKGSINLRIESRTRRLIDEAAAVLGKTRTEFMIESARALAIDVLLDQRLFVLDPGRYERFMQALDNPPAPGVKLRALLRRTPAWANDAGAEKVRP